jgi:hypothetical protein
MPPLDTTPPAAATIVLPLSCERALLERFLKAEAMALWSVRASQLKDVPPHVLTFLRCHEAEEQAHLKQFESMLGRTSSGKPVLPRVPQQWASLAVHLFGYETLGLEFAKLLVTIRPDLSSILKDEEGHVSFFERELQRLLADGGRAAEHARVSSRAWWKKLSRTVSRYLGDESLAASREDLHRVILAAIESRFVKLGLFQLLPTVSRPGSTDIPLIHDERSVF